MGDSINLTCYTPGSFIRRREMYALKADYFLSFFLRLSLHPEHNSCVVSVTLFPSPHFPQKPLDAAQ